MRVVELSPSRYLAPVRPLLGLGSRIKEDLELRRLSSVTGLDVTNRQPLVDGEEMGNGFKNNSRACPSGRSLVMVIHRLVSLKQPVDKLTPPGSWTLLFFHLGGVKHT